MSFFAKLGAKITFPMNTLNMVEQENQEKIIDQIPSHVLDLMLDVLLEVMGAERGSIMLLDEKGDELTIRSARGLKKEIIEKARVRLGRGISGKVAATGQPVLIKGFTSEQQKDIEPDDLINPDIHTSYSLPIKVHGGTLGTININSTQPSHEILAEKEQLVQGILYRFLEYFEQIDKPGSEDYPPSQLYMMNIFREYNTLRELRIVFDYIFYLVTDLLTVKKKGVFILINQESDFFDLVLGYGFDTKIYRQIYEELIPHLKEAKFQSLHKITIINREELFKERLSFFQEDKYILMPLVWRDKTRGMLFIFSDKQPTLDRRKEGLLQTVCDAAARTILESEAGQRFKDLTYTDSLTGTYNYGLWWKRLHEEFSRAERIKDSKISLMIFDIDHLERFNRAYGYFAGDQLLRLIADRIKSSLRVNDIVGRIGGDEFGAVLPDTSKESTNIIAERILESVSGIPTEMRVQLSYPFTLSCGIAGFPKDADEPGKLVERAKVALVSAKIMGGNRIKLFEHLEE